MKILNSFSLKPEQRQTLEAAGHTVIDADKLDDATAQQIDVVYGWNAAATRVNFDRLQFVQAMSAGVDYLPLAELAKHHVLLANTRDRKSTRLNSSHCTLSRMPSSA